MELVVALDLPSKEDNLQLIKSIKEYPLWLKVGLRSFIRDGADFIKEIQDINPSFKIFLDLKLYDIPNTMAESASEIANLNIQMFNLHISAGERALRMVVERLKESNPKPLIFRSYRLNLLF